MAATFSASLVADKDWVRLLIGDTDTATAQLQDETITAAIAAEATNGGTGGANPAVYLAAAKLLASLYARWTTAGGGIVEKQVSKLRIKRGVGEAAGQAIEARIRSLREEGARLLRPAGTKYFGAL